MSGSKNVGGHYYPEFHPGWGGFAEELFHYTSRYHHAAEAFVRHLAQQPAFSMQGYKAANLSEEQRVLMAAVLSTSPGGQSAQAVAALVGDVIRGRREANPHLQQLYRQPLHGLDIPEPLVGHPHPPHTEQLDVAPLDPFISQCERLQLPIVVNQRHVEVCMHTLARHLDSPNAAIRSNLHEAVLQLHQAGFTLRNHPHLTHAEAQRLDEGDE